MTSLTQGIPVLMGANDATCAAYSPHMVHHGDIMDVTGHTEMVVVCMDKPLAASKYNLKNHVVPDRWNAMFALNTGGKAIEWVYTQFFRDMDESYFYDRLIPQVVAGDRKNIPGFSPYLTGDRYSLKVQVSQLHSDHSKYHKGRYAFGRHSWSRVKGEGFSYSNGGKC